MTTAPPRGRRRRARGGASRAQTRCADLDLQRTMADLDVIPVFGPALERLLASLGPGGDSRRQRSRHGDRIGPRADRRGTPSRPGGEASPPDRERLRCGGRRSARHSSARRSRRFRERRFHGRRTSRRCFITRVCTPRRWREPRIESPVTSGSTTRTTWSPQRCCTTSASSSSRAVSPITRRGRTLTRRPSSACASSATRSGSTTRASAGCCSSAGVCPPGWSTPVAGHHNPSAQRSPAGFVRLADMVAHHAYGNAVDRKAMLQLASAWELPVRTLRNVAVRSAPFLGQPSAGVPSHHRSRLRETAILQAHGGWSACGSNRAGVAPVSKHGTVSLA